MKGFPVVLLVTGNEGIPSHSVGYGNEEIPSRSVNYGQWRHSQSFCWLRAMKGFPVVLLVTGILSCSVGYRRWQNFPVVLLVTDNEGSPSRSVTGNEGIPSRSVDYELLYQTYINVLHYYIIHISMAIGRRSLWCRVHAPLAYVVNCHW